MSGLTACPRKCGTLIAACVRAGVCSSCRRDDANGARKAAEQAVKAAARKRQPRLTLDLADYGTKSDRNANTRSASANRCTNAKKG